MVSIGPRTVCAPLHFCPTSSTALPAVRSRSFIRLSISIIGIISSSVRKPIVTTFAAIIRRGVHQDLFSFFKFMSIVPSIV